MTIIISRRLVPNLLREGKIKKEKTATVENFNPSAYISKSVICIFAKP